MISELERMLSKDDPRDRFVYEVLLRTAEAGAGPADPEKLDRALRAMAAVERDLGVAWVDVLIDREGLYLRLRLGRASSLREVLALFFERSRSDASPAVWRAEPAWMRMVTPDRSPAPQRDLFNPHNGSLQGFLYYAYGKPGAVTLPGVAA